MSATLRPISLLPAAPTNRAPQSLTIRWEISPAALLASPGAAILNGEAPRLKSVDLLWHVDPTTARAELSLQLTGGDHHTIPLAGPITISRTTIDDIEHIEATGLTLALGDEQVLYARTSLIGETLSLPGGTYDAPAIPADH